MKNSRPMNLNLFTMKFPVTAIASILHRMSGVLLFLFIPLVLWWLQQSLLSQQDYNALLMHLNSAAIKYVVWIFLAGLLFHLFAGIRHLMMDAGFAESLKAGRFTSYVVIGVSLIFIILAGVWLW